MAQQPQNPARKLLAEFEAGRISRRQFLTAFAALSGAAALGTVPAFAAQRPASPLAVARNAKRRQPAPALLIYGGAQDIATIDPSDRTDYSIGALTRQIYDRLFRFEGGWPNPLEPGLCSEWSANEDGSVWTFTLVENAVFHDGSPVVASDVVFSYQRTLRAQKARSSLLSGLLDVDGIAATDDYTVVMTLKVAYGAFDRFLGFHEQGIMNEELVMANAVDGDEGANWLIDHEAGSGPFMIGDWQIGSRYELVAVDDYWQGWPGESHISGVVWVKTEDPGTRKTGLLSGDFDMIDTVSVTDIEEINGSADTIAEINYGLLAGYFKYNNQQGPTADVNFRKFLNYSFDKQAFADSQQGYVALMTGPLPEGVPGYDPELDPQYSYDPAKAREHLDMTEYAAGGFSIDFVYVSGLDFEEAAGLILLDELQDYNITVNMVPKNWPDIVGACSAPESGPAIAFIFDAFPPLADSWLIEKYSSASWDRPTGGSFVACDFYKNEEVDAKLEELRVTSDPDAAAALVADIQTTISNDAPDLPLYVGPNIVAFNNRVKGYIYYGDISVDFWRLWIDDAE